MTDNNDKQERRGAPDGNTNAAKHHLFTERDNLYQNLDAEEKRFVVELSSDLLERLEGDIGAYEREVVRNLAIDTLKRTKANEFLADNDWKFDAERPHKLYSRIRRDNISEMKEMGLNLQSPEAKEAESKAQWFEAIKEAEEDE